MGIPSTIMETPKQAAGRLARSVINGDYTAEALHPYTAADGALLFWRIRARLPNGDKWIRPMHLNGDGYVLGEPKLAGPRPLYRVHEIAKADPTVPVFYVEGELKADKLANLGVIATTAGSATSDDRTDYSALKGRTVYPWPDNDQAGREHMQRVAAKLLALGCAVETVNIDTLGLPAKGDVVDWLLAHPDATAADLMALRRTPVAPAAAPPTGPRVELLRGDEVKIEPVRWLWNGWLARGKLHILAGAPGTGKTTIALAFAATLTSGGQFPDESRCEAADVLIWTGEDGIGDALAPRLAAMGADLKRVHFVSAVHDSGGRRAFDPATDVATLLDTLRAREATPGLLIVDPIVNAILGDSHKNAEVRQGLAPLVELAGEIDCALLGISHFTKGTAGRDPVERVTGSLAFGALARVVLAAAKKPEDQGGGRLLARAKSNIGPDGGGFGYSLDVMAVPKYPNVQATRVLWGAALQGTARELLADAEVDSEAGGEQRDAAEWLREVIEEAGGHLDAKEAKRLAKDAGFPERTIERAKARAGVKSERDGFGKGARYIWLLDPMSATCTPCTPTKLLGEHGEHGGEHEHLRGEADQPLTPAEPKLEVL